MEDISIGNRSKNCFKMVAIGQLLDGRYRVIQPLGAGGFGHTYLAQDTKIPNNPTCVVKHLKPASNDPQVLDTAKRFFKAEAETLASLGSHPQIPRLLAYFEEYTEFYLVQEYIPGHTLDREILPGQKWTEGQIIALLQEVLPVLKFVHDRGAIHRDIKPSNLMRRISPPHLGVGESESLVLIDFGAIKQIQSQVATNAQSVSVAIGTPGYMPIEQLRGQPRPSSDIYALGMLCLQALTGRSPQDLPEDPNTGEVVWHNLVAVSPGLAAILGKMTRNFPQNRYQNASEVIFDLERLQPPQIPTPFPLERQYEPTLPIAPQVGKQQPSNRSPLVPLLVAGGAIAAIAAGFAYPYMLQAFKSGNSDLVETTPTPTAIGVATCTATVSGLNIREQPNTEAKAISSLNAGDSMALTGEKDGTWLKIAAPTVGWVSKRDNKGRVLVNCPGDVEVEETKQPVIKRSPRTRNTPTVRRSPRVQASSTPSPTVKPTPTSSPTPTPIPSETVTPTPTPELTPTPEPTSTPTETPEVPVETPATEAPAPSNTPIPITVPSPEKEGE